VKHERSDVARHGGGAHSSKPAPLARLVDYYSWAPPILRPGQYLHSVTNGGGHYVDPQPGTKRHAALQLPGGLKDAKR